jgi:hypothetical protein
MKLTDIDRTLGKTFKDRLGRPVLTVGRALEVSAHALVTEYGCANVVAAQGLSATLKRLRVTTLEELAKIDPASLYRVHGCGHTQVYVAMCLLERHGVSPTRWWGWATKGDSVQRHARASKRKRGAHEAPRHSRGEKVWEPEAPK